MRIYQHFSVVGFCNTYLISSSDGSDAILIDPGHVDTELIHLIESNKFKLKHVLLTHRHKAHTAGLGTLVKIYNPTIYASAFATYEYPIRTISDHQVLSLCNLEVEVIHVPGHSLDSLVFKIGHALFTGDTLMCGRVGSTDGYREQALLLRSIWKRLMTLDENILLFPGHGTASKLRIERMFNHQLLELGAVAKERQNWREDE
ncbi:MAG: MBL fold metallo-hydrolase [Sphaerochaeta sp.]